MPSIVICPKCQSQLEVKISFASGPRESNATQAPFSQPGTVGELLEQIDDGALSGATAKFVTETRERFEKYGPRTKMSEKQMAWLSRIAAGETGNNDW